MESSSIVVPRRSYRRQVLVALAAIVLLASALYLLQGFRLTSGEHCDAALTSLDNATVTTETMPISLPNIEPPSIPGASVVQQAYEVHTTRTPTPCAIASRTRFYWPAVGLAVVGTLLALDSEARAWRTPRSVNRAVPWWPTSPWVGPASAAAYFGIGVLYAVNARLAPNMVFFGTGALFIGLIARNARNARGRDRMYQIVAAPALWVGSACLIVAAVRLA